MSRNHLQVLEPSMSELRNFLGTLEQVPVFQLAEVVEVYRNARGCRPLVLALADPRGCLQASVVSVTFTGPIGIPHASIRGGPVCSPFPPAEEYAFRLLERHEELVGKSTIYTRIYPMSVDEASVRLATRCGFAHGGWLNFIVTLDAPNRMWARFSKARRKGIRQAQQADVHVRELLSDADLRVAVRLLRATAKRNRIPLQDRTLFGSIRERLVPKGLARMLLADIEGVPVATRILLVHGGTLYDWYAGSESWAHRFHPDELLVWEAFQWGQERGLDRFDFGGAGPPGLPYGPREFKRRFGGKEVDLGRFTNDHYPRLTGALRRIYDLYQGGATS